jgi:hypothetical protein
MQNIQAERKKRKYTKNITLKTNNKYLCVWTENLKYFYKCK